LERAGIPTALLCNLVSIAERVGAPRIVPTRGIPYPTGDPSLSRPEEEAWRRQLLETALRAVSTPVQKPTVFAADGAQDEEGNEEAEVAHA
jgi:glycine reductase